MATEVPYGPYSDVAAYVTTKPGWVPPAHQDRIAAYQVYQEIYWSHVASGYKIMNRGLDGEDKPVYVPSSRIVVDTLDRYIAPKLTFTVDPATGNESSQIAATQAFTALFARERFASRYAAGKRDGLIKGDWGWHLTADPMKLPGSRISLTQFDPGSYFPVYEDETVLGGDPDKLVMVVLAEQVKVGEDDRVRTQRYIRQPNGQIMSTVDLWETDKWFLWRYDDDTAQPVATVVPASLLPPQVTAFPVYHVPHRPESNADFGSSPMRGLVGLQAALNQANTDEDLALALTGLGVYATDAAGSPIGTDGQPTSWFIYPGAVIENGKGLRKVEGLTTLQPYTDHIGRFEGYMADATGATDAARGRVEVQEAESGIALQLRLGPTLAMAETQDTIVLDVHRQLFYDLVTMWFPAFEALNFTDVTVLPSLGDKLPLNRTAEAELVNGLVLTGVLSKGSARLYLEKKGFTGMFDPREGDLVLAEKVGEASAEMGGAEEDRALQEQAGQNPDDGGLDDGPQV